MHAIGWRVRVVTERITVAILPLPVLNPQLRVVTLGDLATLPDCIALSVRSETGPTRAVALALPATVRMGANVDSRLFQDTFLSRVGVWFGPPEAV